MGRLGESHSFLESNKNSSKQSWCFTLQSTAGRCGSLGAADPEGTEETIPQFPIKRKSKAKMREGKERRGKIKEVS